MSTTARPGAAAGPASGRRCGVWLLKLGIEIIHSQPYHPQGRGKNERFHRTLDAEVFSLAPLPGFDDAQAAFDRWRHVYNRERPHQALGFATPAERYRPSKRALPETLPAPAIRAGEIVRRVGTTKAYVSFRNRLWKVPEAFRGECSPSARAARRPLRHLLRRPRDRNDRSQCPESAETV